MVPIGGLNRWGRLAFQLDYVEDATVETLQVNGKAIRYSPAFIESLTNAEVQGVIAHELAHCAFGHIFRQGSRDHDDWNVAADYAINGILEKAGLTLPAGALLNDAFDGQSADTIYADLHGRGKDDQNQQQSPGGAPQSGAGDSGQPQSGSGSPEDDGQSHDFGGCGEMTEPASDAGDILSPADRQRLENEWRIAAEQAMQAGKACGKLGEDIEREIGKLRRPKIDWRAVLAEFIQSSVTRRYTWTRPNRRFVGSGIYLPSLKPDGVGEIVIGVDTSGSITPDELDQFASEIFDIIETARPELVHVVYCHSRVTNVEAFTPDDPPDKLAPVGSGGTRFRPVFDWVEDHDIDPVCLIYLTDLECSDWPGEPDYPVLWISTNYYPEKVAPVGETVHMGRV